MNPGRVIVLYLLLRRGCSTSTVEVRGQLGDQEWKLLGDIDAHGELLGEVGIAVGVGEDDIDDLARAAQRRGPHFHPGQRRRLRKLFGGLGIDGWITHRQVVQGTVLVGRAGIVRHLHDRVEQFLGRRAELRGRRLSRPRDGFDQRVAIEGIDWSKATMGTMRPLHISGGAIGPRKPMTTSMSLGLGTGRIASTSRSMSAGSRGTSK